MNQSRMYYDICTFLRFFIIIRLWETTERQDYCTIQKLVSATEQQFYQRSNCAKNIESSALFGILCRYHHFSETHPTEMYANITKRGQTF